MIVSIVDLCNARNLTAGVIQARCCLAWIPFAPGVLAHLPHLHTLTKTKHLYYLPLSIYSTLCKSIHVYICMCVQRDDSSNGSHDEVDFSLCFEDTAILYGVCLVVWILAAFVAVCAPYQRKSLPLSLLHLGKIVSSPHCNS